MDGCVCLWEEEEGRMHCFEKHGIIPWISEWVSEFGQGIRGVEV